MRSFSHLRWHTQIIIHYNYVQGHSPFIISCVWSVE